MSIEEEIKEQYSKIFKSADSITFKLMADFYFENAAKILKKDISIRDQYSKATLYWNRNRTFT